MATVSGMHFLEEAYSAPSTFQDWKPNLGTSAKSAYAVWSRALDKREYLVIISDNFC